MPKEIFITVPLEPPSVNHYAKHTRQGQHYVSTATKRYRLAVAIHSTGLGEFTKGELEVWLTVYRGKGSRGDIDNAAKVPLDALVKVGVIHSDAAVVDLHLHKRRDWANPRTEIRIAKAAKR